MDEPVQLIGQSSNIVNLVADDKAYDADKIAFIPSFYVSGDAVWVVCAVLHFYTILLCRRVVILIGEVGRPC